MINKVILAGRIERIIHDGKRTDGERVVKFAFKTWRGQFEEIHDIIAYSKLGNLFDNELHLGDIVSIVGELQQRQGKFGPKSQVCAWTIDKLSTAS